ncbi:hypothetical protein Pla52n_56600 [Stieleria varia]|uniref:DUF6487 domain-containing protein n=2 Tax=Stieleria varia TaxID=2528005 RepID=A0A5C6A1V7_9BACT|nr:hypothetical protein Pla52n_56600 [Stieleria varia]
MDDGDLSSSAAIRWRSYSDNPVQTFLTGGRKIANSKSGFGFRVPAHFCGHCRLMLIKR